MGLNSEMMTSFSDDLVIRPKADFYTTDDVNFDDVEFPADATSQNVICVFNLPQETKDDQLQSFFGRFGRINKIYTIRDKYKGEGMPTQEPKCKGYAFIYYQQPESAHKARDEANNTEFRGRVIRVDISLTAKKERVEAPLSDILGVFGLPPDVSAEEVKTAFLDKGTEAMRVNLVKEKPSGRCKGFGFVYFPSVPSAKAAKEACRDLVIKGHMVRVDYSLTREPREAEQKVKSPPATSFPRGARPCNVLGCFGLPSATTEQDVKNLFNNYGQVFKVDIVMDKSTGRCKGYGFVYFTKTDDATQAFEAFTSGEAAPVIKGQTIRVDYSLTTAPPQTRSNADGGMMEEDKRKKGGRKEMGGKSDSGEQLQQQQQQQPQQPPQQQQQQYVQQMQFPAAGMNPHFMSQGMPQMGGNVHAMQAPPPTQPAVLKLEGVPEDLLNHFPLPPQQELEKSVGYARGYDDCRVSMLRTMDQLIKAGRLIWNPMPMGMQGMGMQPGLGMNIQGLNGVGNRQGIVIGQQGEMVQAPMQQQDQRMPNGMLAAQSGNGLISPQVYGWGGAEKIQSLPHFYLPPQTLLPTL
eukprot:TRINITY_DN231_c0_g1_i1.p1 TRINITY_DN231_c0_g1~~TRINITY_DN231_c0_g1_i1.p1  ORF type:complete len:577 (+),score=211.78 TRINITY_DN231_c0_g1_i1:138-1868(+)